MVQCSDVVRWRSVSLLLASLSFHSVSRQNRHKKRHHRHHKPRHIDSVSQYGDPSETGTELESIFDESDMTR